MQGSALCFILYPSSPAFGDNAWLGCLCASHPFLDAFLDGCCCICTHVLRVAPLGRTCWALGLEELGEAAWGTLLTHGLL